MAKPNINDPKENDEITEFPAPTDPILPNSLPPPPGLGTYPAPLPAKSQWSTGRGCPRCAGDLKLFEYVEADQLVVLQCKKCLKKWFETDLDSDELYRIIPPEAILRELNKIDRGAILKAREEG